MFFFMFNPAAVVIIVICAALAAGGVFALWRYDYVDEVTMPDAEENAFLERGVPSLPNIAVDYGNKSNYRACEDVVISSFNDGENLLEIYCGDELIETLTFNGRGKTARRFARGYYTIKHKNTGDIVEFCVTDPWITHTAQDGKLTLNVDAGDPGSKITHMEFRERSKGELMEKGIPFENNGVAYYSPAAAVLSKVEVLTEEEKNSGIITREIPVGAIHYKVSFENKYGVWTHTMIRITENA